MGVLEERRALDEEWRRRVDTTLDEHMERLDAGDTRMTELAEKMDTNNNMTAEIKSNTATLVGWVNNIKGFNNVTNWAFAMLIKASVIIIAAGVVFWFVKTGDLPRKL